MQPVLEIFEPKTAKVETSFCDFCGEYCSNASFKSTNHSIIFNGWCIKALMFHNQIRHYPDPEKIAWLLRNNIDPNKSRFEQGA